MFLPVGKFYTWISFSFPFFSIWKFSIFMGVPVSHHHHPDPTRPAASEFYISGSLMFADRYTSPDISTLSRNYLPELFRIPTCWFWHRQLSVAVAGLKWAGWIATATCRVLEGPCQVQKGSGPPASSQLGWGQQAPCVCQEMPPIGYDTGPSPSLGCWKWLAIHRKNDRWAEQTWDSKGHLFMLLVHENLKMGTGRGVMPF